MQNSFKKKNCSVKLTDTHNILPHTTLNVVPVVQLEWRLTTGWTVRDRIPVWTRFSARPDRPWGPPSLLENE